MKDFNEDVKLLEELGLSNVCLVKKYDPITAEYLPSHFIFTYWINRIPFSFRAIITDKGYAIYYKDNLLFKTESLLNIVKNLERKKVKTQLTNDIHKNKVKIEGDLLNEDE